MITSMNDLIEVANKHGVPPEDVLLMALNLTGIQTQFDFGRVRFALTLHPNELFGLANRTGIKDFYLAVPVMTGSPFSIIDSELRFDSLNLGSLQDVSEDLCNTNYPRRAGTVMNLNANRRTSCGGCRFCYTGYQVPNEKDDLRTATKLRLFFQEWLRGRCYVDLSHLMQIAVVTGCFENELEMVAFLKLLRDVSSEFGFTGEIFYLGSQVTEPKSLVELQAISPFAYCISFECFENRDQMVRDKKRFLSVDKLRQLLDKCTELGHEATFSYIIGLDSDYGFRTGFDEVAGHVTRFPIVNLLQTHQRQINLRHPDASDIGFYLRARKHLEGVFKGERFVPRPWENYRGLWYLRYRDQILSDVRMPWIRTESRHD